MTRDPDLITFRFEPVIVQNEPAAPVNWEHYFVTLSTPLRGDGDSASAVGEPTTSARTTTAAPAAIDVPMDARNERVVLALVLQRPGIVESDAEQAAGAMGPRYRVAEVEVGVGLIWALEIENALAVSAAPSAFVA